MTTRLAFAAQVLRDNQAQVLDLLGPLTDAQFALRPTPASWTPLEVLEHVVLIERGTVRMLTAGIEQGTAAPERPLEKLVAWDQKMMGVITDRSMRIVAPEPLKPRGKFSSGADALAAFTEWRQQAITVAAAPTWDLATRVAPHPVLGPIDGVQWLIFLAGHSARHLLQVQEILSAPDLPQ